MAPEALSDQIVAVATVVMGAACLATAGAVFHGWRSRPKDRTEQRLQEMSQQLRAVSVRLQTADHKSRQKRELPTA